MTYRDFAASRLPLPHSTKASSSTKGFLSSKLTVGGVCFYYNIHGTPRFCRITSITETTVQGHFWGGSTEPNRSSSIRLTVVAPMSKLSPNHTIPQEPVW